MNASKLGTVMLALTATLCLFAATVVRAGNSDQKQNDDEAVSKIRIEVTGGDASKPVANASVYLRWDEEGGMLHRKKEVELNFKTNQEGVVKIPDIPRRKILVQIVAPGWHTYGKYYDISKDEELIQIKLEKPPRWY
jgi:hypothetical protein